jgi:tetratricopeptide (TPR) repeat protein
LIAGRLFVPFDAALEPPITDAELRNACGLPVSFFHPVHGLSAFEKIDELDITHLIEPPQEHDTNWNFARPGAPAMPALRAVTLLTPPSIQDLFGGAENEIGTEPPTDLPSNPAEPSQNPAANVGRALGKMVAGGLSNALSKVPRVGASWTWLNELEAWANRKLEAVSDELERLRNKEIHRLLHLLESDPETGLRHAISLSTFAHRGKVPPGGRLGTRSLNLNLGQLGSGPADFWNLDPSMQQLLRNRYRELADRELQLGRHRRAAYIYAELLGDLLSAANVLKQGKFYREAALLYEHQLRNPLEAAKCLAEGGLLSEAIEKYIALNHWLEVAELHERMGNRAAAVEVYERIIRERLAQHDVLGAVRLVEERLNDNERALELLLEGWARSHQAGACLAKAFQLFARLGKHEAALKQLASLNQFNYNSIQLVSVLTVMGDAARQYPDATVRHRAADCSRNLIGRHLQEPRLPRAEAARLVDQLVRLVPQDRLLTRDGNRYLQNLRSQEFNVRRITTTSDKQPQMLRQFQLPQQIQWLRLRRESDWFFALGTTPRRLTLLRGIWTGEYQSLSWECPSQHVEQGIVFEPTGNQGRYVALARAVAMPFPEQHFPASDLFFNRVCVVGTPAWCISQYFPIAVGDDAYWSFQSHSNHAVLTCHDKARGDVRRTVDVTEDLFKDSEVTERSRISMAVAGNTVAVALGNRFVYTRGDGGTTRVELPGQVIRMEATLPGTRRGFAVMLEFGAVMCWVGVDRLIELERDLRSPGCAFVPGGPMILASGTAASLLDVDSRGIQASTKLDLAGRSAVSACAGSSTGEFAILNERGQVTLYSMSR